MTRLDRLRRALRHRRLVAAAAAVGILAVLTVVAAARYLPAFDDARQLRSSVERMAGALESAGLGLDEATMADITSDFDAASAHLDRLEDLVTSDPLIALARAFPPTASMVASVDDLAAAARDLQSAGMDGMILARRYVDLRQAAMRTANAVATIPSSGPLPEMVELLASSRDGIDRAMAAVERARGHLAAAGRLPAQLGGLRASLLAQIERWMPGLEASRTLAAALPSITGWDGERRYLVLAEDPAELRPTGGFIGTVGIATFDHGALGGLDFHDVYDFDLRAGVPYVTPPDGLRGHLLGNRSWQLADANWSPDFPESAQAAARLYSLETGDTRIDGVIALTTYAIDDLLRLTGPIEVPGYGVSVRSGETTVRALAATRRATAPGTSRKAFLGEFGSIVAGRLAALPASSWSALLDQVQAIGSTRQAMAWFADAEIEARVARGNWGGALRSEAGDYLQVVDANVAPSSKLNAVVDRSLRLDVAIDDVGNAHESLAIQWTNGIDGPAGSPYRRIEGFGNREVLGDFFRLVVPDRSRLRALEGTGLARIEGAESIEKVASRLAFGAYVPIGSAGASASAAWVSPYAADVSAATGSYRLVVQKQAGTRSDSIDLSISIPDGARIVAASPSLRVAGRTARFTGSLATDLDVWLTYSIAATTNATLSPLPTSSQEH